MKKFDYLEQFDVVVSKEWSKLDSVDPQYLSEAGKAAMEAYQAVIWVSEFCDTFEELYDNKDYKSLVTIPGKHPEYYAVLRKLDRIIEFNK